MHPPQMPDALGGVRSGRSTALRGWTGCGITETLRALITLKGPQWSQRFQWSQWFIWTTNDTKGGERRERVSCLSWFFARFVIQSTDAQIDTLKPQPQP